MGKKRFSIFNFNKEYNPRSIWDAGFGDLGEVEEEPLYTTEMPENKTVFQIQSASSKPKDIFNELPASPPYSPDRISSSEKKSMAETPNTLKVNHQRVIEKTEKNQDNISKPGDRFNELSAIPLKLYTLENSTNSSRPAKDTISEQKNNLPKTNIGNNNVFSGKGPLDPKFLDEEIIYLPTTGKKNLEKPIDFLNRSAMPPIKYWGQDLSGSDILSPYFPNRSGMSNQEINTFLQNITPEQLDSINGVYSQYAEDARQILQSMYGQPVNPIKGIQFIPDTWGQSNIEYKDGVITAKRGFLGRNEFEKRSDILHETQHHADKDKLPFRKEKGKDGKEIFNETTNKINNVYQIGDDELSKLYSPEEWKKEKEKYNTLYKYQPSNTVRSEINAVKQQIKAHQLGIIPLSETDFYTLQENLKSYYDYLRLALEYEKEKKYAPTGYPIK